MEGDLLISRAHAHGREFPVTRIIVISPKTDNDDNYTDERGGCHGVAFFILHKNSLARTTSYHYYYSEM